MNVKHCFFLFTINIVTSSIAEHKQSANIFFCRCNDIGLSLFNLIIVIVLKSG